MLIAGNAWDGVYVHGPDVPTYSWAVSDGGNGHYYLIAPSLTWPAAEAAAVQLGGHLLDINDAAELAAATATDAAGYTSEFSLAVPVDPVDPQAPTSRVNPLPPTASSLSFDVSVSGHDLESSPGVPGSWIAFFDIYVSTDQGAFQHWTRVSGEQPTASFRAQSNRT